MGPVVPPPSSSCMERGKALLPPARDLLLSLTTLFGLAVLLCGPTVFDKSPSDFNLKQIVLMHVAGGMIAISSLAGLYLLHSSDDTPAGNSLIYAPPPAPRIPLPLGRVAHKEEVVWLLPGDIRIEGYLSTFLANESQAFDLLIRREQSVWEGLSQLEETLTPAILRQTIQNGLRHECPIHFRGIIYFPNEELTISIIN